MKPTEKENREELLTLAVDLLGDSIALNCVAEHFHKNDPWDGIVRDTLLQKLGSMIRFNSEEIALMAGRIVQSSQGSLGRDQPSVI